MPKNPNWTRDELILALDLYLRTRGTPLSHGHPEVVKLSSQLNGLPIHKVQTGSGNFRNESGVYMKVMNFRRLDSAHPGTGLSHGNGLEIEVWDEFAKDPEGLRNLAEAILAAGQILPVHAAVADGLLDDEDALEGTLLLRLHHVRERNRRLRDQKKRQAMSREQRLRCESCDFVYEDFYGALGADFIEVHHVTPLAKLAKQTTTHLADLALLCANCHRMLHRSSSHLTPAELRGLTLKQNEP